MKRKIDQALTIALARIELCQQRIAALEFAVEPHKKDAQSIVSELYTLLYKDLHNAYQNYFLLAGIIGGEEHEKAKRIAYKKYFADGVEIMSRLSLDGQPPHIGYSAADEEQFRKELEELAK